MLRDPCRMPRAPGRASRSRAGRRLVLGLVLGPWLGACGSDSARESPPPFERVRLEPAADALAPRESRVLARWVPDAASLEPAEPASWSVSAEAWSLVPIHSESEGAGGPGTGLALAGPVTRLRVPCDVPAVDSNALAIDLVSEGHMGLRAGLRRGEEVVGGAGRSFLGPGRHRVVFDLASARLAGERFTELEVLGRPPKSVASVSWTLLSVELLERYPEARLPPARFPPEPVQVGDEWRAAAAVTSRAPLSAAVDIEGADASLVFGLARAPYAAGPEEHGTPPRLRIEIRGEDAESERLLELGLPRAGVWTRVTRPLARFSGQRVELRFSIVSDGEGSGPAPFAAGLLSEVAIVRPDPDAPTVLMITSDTHRGDHLGATSEGAVLTATLDELAARGMLFERAFASTNVTLPSHASLLTGLDPRASRVENNYTRLPDVAPTLAEQFRDAGWLTWAVTSVRFLDHGWSGMGRGFDRASAPEDEASAAESVAALQRALPEADGRPLFVWLHVFDAHRPYEPPPQWESRYWPKDRDPFDRSLPEPDFPPLGARELRDPQWPRARYRGEISALDEELRGLLAERRVSRGIVAFTADHGESLGEHDIWWNHVGLYPECLHVPLILAWPGAPAARRVQGTTRQIDLGRTLLDLAGLESVPFPGRSLLEPQDEERPSFALASEGSAASVTRGRWHLIVSLRDLPKNLDESFGSFHRHVTELYDLERDPGCEHDLARERPELARELRGRLAAWLASGGERAPATVLDEESLALLEQLGTQEAPRTRAGRRWTPIAPARSAPPSVTDNILLRILLTGILRQRGRADPRPRGRKRV